MPAQEFVSANPAVRRELSRIPTNEALYIGNIVLPYALAPSERFDYFTAENYEIILDDLRAPGALAKIVELDGPGKNSGTLNEHMLKLVVDQRDIDEAVKHSDELGGQSLIATKLARLRRIILDLEEYRKGALAFNSANYGGTHKASNVDFGATGVFGYVDAAREVIFTDFGKMPRVLALGTITFRVLKSNPDIVGRYQRYGQDKGPINEATLADFFEVDQVVVGRAAAKIAGVATRFWTEDSALLAASDTPATATIDDQAFGVTAYLPYGPEGAQVDVRTDGPKGVERIVEAACAKRYRPMLLNTNGAYLFTNTDQT